MSDDQDQAMDLVNRSIQYGAQVANIAAEGLMETFLPNTRARTSDHMCAMCQEPGYTLDGEFVHRFSGKAKCTYKSHL